MSTIQDKYRNIFGVDAAPALEAIALEEADLTPDNRGDVFSMKSMNREILQWDKISGLGRFKETAEAAQAESDSTIELGLKTYTAIKFALKLGISEEMIDDARGDLIEKQVRALARAGIETQNYSAWNHLNNAFGSSQSFDGVSLISNAHPTPVGNQSNLLTAADLDISSLKLADQTMRKFKDDRGKRLLLTPTTLIVTTDDRHNAIELTKSPFLPGGANNNINSVDQFKIVESPYLVDADAWFLKVATSDPMNGQKIYDRKSLSRELHEDKIAGVMYYISKYRQAIGSDEFRGIVGNPGQG